MVPGYARTECPKIVHIPVQHAQTIVQRTNEGNWCFSSYMQGVNSYFSLVISEQHILSQFSGRAPQACRPRATPRGIWRNPGSVQQQGYSGGNHET